MQLVGNWNYPTRVWIGPGRIAELGAACALAGLRKPLLVTDKILAGMPMIGASLAALAKAGMPTTLFSDVQGNPVETNVYRGVEALRAGAHDGVIAFGAGLRSTSNAMTPSHPPATPRRRSWTPVFDRIALYVTEQRRRHARLGKCGE